MSAPISLGFSLGEFSGLPRNLLAVLVTAGSLGLFLGHPNPFVHIPLLVLWAPFVLYMLAWFSRSGREAFLQGWLTGVIGQSAALYWLTMPITQVGGLPLALAVPCVVLLGCYLSVYTGLACLGIRNALVLWGREPKSGSGTKTGSASACAQGALCVVLPALAGGLAWGGFEAILGWAFTGFPWLCLSTAFVPWTAWVQAAAVTGSYALSGVYAAGACLFAAALLGQGKGRIAALCLSLIICAGLPVVGSLRLDAAPLPEQMQANGQPSLTALLVQGNIDQGQKWIESFRRMAVDRHLDLTRKGLANAAAPGKTVDLVLWPETAMPFYFQPGDGHSETLRRFAIDNNVTMAFGTLGYKLTGPEQMVLFNRVQFISPDGRFNDHYDKEHLVPFGEYTPFPLNFNFLRNLLQGVDFSSGVNGETILLPLAPRKVDPLADAYVPPAPASEDEKPIVVMHGTSPKRDTLALGMLICYEVIFPELAQRRVAGGAGVLVTVSNDAWFGATSAPRQHLHQAAMRAVEQKRPMIRDTNTGYTATVDAYGRISDTTALFQEAASIVTVVAENETTIYHSLYPLPQMSLGLLALALLIPSLRTWRWRRR